MPASKEILRLLERAEMLEAYARDLRKQAGVGAIAPMTAEERLGALEYLIHVNAGGTPELWARQHPELYQRLAERLEAVRERNEGAT